MNPESLLHTTAEQLRAEAKQGPGTMFLVTTGVGFFVTRTPTPEQTKHIIMRYDCTKFCDGLTSKQWTALLNKAWTAYQAMTKGAASGQQPAKKP